MYRKPGLGDQPEWLTSFTSSLDEDKPLFRAVVLTALAHFYHLWEKGLIPKDSSGVMVWFLKALDREDEILSGNYEDVHEALEEWLLKNAGKNAGWLAYGKSRNDQVATALRLVLRWKLIRLLWEVNRLRSSLLETAEENVDVDVPLFTHLQPAQPSTVAHYLLYIEGECFHHWRVIWNILREVVDLSPLGSGPIAGSSIPLDRGRLADLLGFAGIEVNTLLATGSRSFAVLSLSSVASLMVSMSRVAEDLIVWSTPQFKIVEIPNDHASTSSIMPQKRNPVTLEMIRAKSAKIIGYLTSLMAIVKGLPSGYNLDLQEANESILAIDEASNSIRVLADLFRKIKFIGLGIPSTLAQDLAEKLVRERNVTYREAHSMLASALRESKWDIEKAAESLGLELPSFEEVLRSRGRGGPNPDMLRSEISSRKKLLQDDIERLTEYEREKKNSEENLLRLAREPIEQ